MEALLSLLLLSGAPDLGCPATVPPVFRGKPGWGITCCADTTEAVAPGEAWLAGNVQCQVHEFRFAAAELTIKRGEDSPPWREGSQLLSYNANVSVEARGDAIARGAGNTLRGHIILVEFDGGTNVKRAVVEGPHEASGGQTRLLPLGADSKSR